MPKKKKAGKALTGENKQLFIDIVQLCSADFRTKPQLVELANEIRLLLQGNTSTEIFEEKLQRDISLPEYKSNGKLNACLQNWMARWVEEGVMEANILRYAKDSVRAEASPIANIGGFVDVAGGVPRGATPGTAAVDSAPSSPANIGGLAVAVAGGVPHRATPSRAGAAASLGGAAFYTPAPQDRQGDPFLPFLMQMSGQMYQDMRASHTTLAATLTEQMVASNTTLTEQLVATNAAHQRTQQQMTTFVARTEEKFKEQGATIDTLGHNVAALGSSVANLQERFDELEYKANRRILFGKNEETTIPRLDAYKKDPKKPKSILKNQSTPTQPFTRPNTKRSRSAQESTAVSTVSKRTTRSMSRKNKK